MNADDLLLISVGGAAATIARRVAENASAPLRALILDTDDATLQAITPAVGVSTTVFGAKRLAGRGTGGDRNLGASALRDDASQIQAQIGAPRLAVLLVCCGGGTSGAAPLLLEMLRALGVATLVFATTPFAFEGDDRHRCAKIILPTLAAQADAITTVPLELLAGGDATLPQAEAFARVADRLGAGLGLLWSLIAHAGFLPLDAERFRRFLTHDVAGGRPFCFAEAVCAGERRADDASRDVTAWLKCRYMKSIASDKQKFRATITAVTSYGLYVQLQDIFVDGFVHISNIGFDYYGYTVEGKLVGETFGEEFAVGDVVTVSLIDVDEDRRRIDFRISRSRR